MAARRRLFAGRQLRKVRETRGLRQADLAQQLGISPAYLSQIEHDDRPLTARLVERVARLFPQEWQDFPGDETESLSVALREALADSASDAAIAPDAIARLAEQQPAFVRRFVDLHEALGRATQRLQLIDETIAVDGGSGIRLPWEDVRDWFHLAQNYVDPLDRAAEALVGAMGAEDGPPSSAMLARHLADAHGIAVEFAPGESLRRYDPDSRRLTIDAGQPASGTRFQLAYQVAATSMRDTIRAIAAGAALRTEVARELLTIGLANYAAGALLMPYEHFRGSARAFRHDIDRLATYYRTSFEQTCHRLSTLQRSGARGLPLFFCRVDMAGNITKRHSATRFQFARFGGTCPLWIVHEAAAIPDRILVQLAETPDGVRYVSMAKGLVKASGHFDRNPRRYAVALGCEVQHAGEFVYADGIDLDASGGATRIGVSCRICPRTDCDQRAYPPTDQQIMVNLYDRGIVPYTLPGQSASARR
jgi:hypothetical protein